MTDEILPTGLATVGGMGGSAFSRSHGLKKVTKIGDAIFSVCSALVDVTIPSTVTIIGDSAFERCTALVSIAIPESVTTIDGGAFRGCSALAEGHV